MDDFSKSDTLSNVVPSEQQPLQQPENLNTNTNTNTNPLGQMLDFSDPSVIEEHVNRQNQTIDNTQFPSSPQRRGSKFITPRIGGSYLPSLSFSKSQSKESPASSSTQFKGKTGKYKGNIKHKSLDEPIEAIEVSQTVLATKAVGSRAPIEKLPEEILLKIFQILSTESLGDLISITRASPIFTRIGLDFTLWPLDLNLTFCSDRISDSVFQSLAPGFSGIKSLSLRKCSNITDITLAWIGKFCLSLTKIDFSFCSNITGRGLYSMFNYKNLTDKLTHIDISYCTQIEYRSLVYIDEFCATLEDLNLSGCPFVATSLLGLRIKAGPSIKTLKLNQLGYLGTSHASNLVEALPHIKSLSLYKCPKVDDRFMSIILPELALVELNIAQTAVTDKSMQMITEYLDSTLICLNISKCKKISAVLPVCRNLTRLDACLCSLQIQALHALSHNLSLNWLNIRNNFRDELGDEALLAIADSGYSQRLKTLWMGHTSRKDNPFWSFGPLEIRAICTSCPLLENFKLPRFSLLDESVFTSFALLENLKVLELSHIPKFLTPSQAESLIQNNQLLEHLIIIGCTKTSIETLTLLTGVIDIGDIEEEDFSEEEEEVPEWDVFDFSNFKSPTFGNSPYSINHVTQILGENLQNLGAWAESSKKHILSPPINQSTRTGLKNLKKIEFQLCPKIPIPIVEDLKLYFSRIELDLIHV